MHPKLAFFLTLTWFTSVAQQAPSPLAIRAGEWTYWAQAELGDQHQAMGSRTIRISLADTGKTAAWVVVLTMETEGVPLTDTVIMRRTDLRPMSRHTISGGTDLLLEVAGSAVHGLLTAQSSLAPINVRLPHKSFLNYHSMRAAFARIPLREGWTGEANVLELGGEPVFVTVALKVVGDERITVPAGEFDCWRVTVTSPKGIDEVYWIGKETRDVIRTREPIGGQGAIMQLDLASFVPRP